MHDTPSWVPAGSVFHIRIRCAPENAIPLIEPKVGRSPLESALFYESKQRWKFRVFLLMPDHVHALLAFPEQESMSKVVGQWKSFHTRKNGIHWQENYFDHRLRGDEQIGFKADYIRNNPVAKGLYQTPNDWPWWIAPSRRDA